MFAHLHIFALALWISICGAVKLDALSFEGPFDKVDANGQRYINGTWIHGGSAEVKKNFVRLTTDRQNKKGYVWTNEPIAQDSFATILTFRISGQGKRWFGDGIGLWLTDSPNYVYGENHGFTADFKGVGIIMDTFINPDHKGGHKDVSIQINDGTKSLQQLNDEKKIGCDAALRYHEESAAFNPAHSASRIKVKVVQQTLTIDVDEKSTGQWKKCYEGTVPFSYGWLRTATLGITAATGGVADNHDILRIVSFDGVNDKDISEDDSAAVLQNMSKEYRKWLDEPSCHTDCRIAVLTKQIENFRVESEHILTDLKEKTSNTISKLRDQEQVNENRLDKIYQRIVNIVDTKVQNKIADTATQVKNKIDEKVKNTAVGGGWKIPFLILTLVLFGAVGVAYQKYQALRKSHLLMTAKICFLVVCLLQFVHLYISQEAPGTDAFDAADEDHDGVIQRQEFVKWSEKIQNAIEPYLVPRDNSKPLPLNTNERVRPDSTIESANTAGKRGKGNPNKFWGGFISGIVTIWATEVGDKTFFIAAILSMKHDRIIVFAGAISALIVMTVLSVALGGVAALLLPPWLTHYAGAVLFVFFGVKMLYDSREMNANGPSEELTEVEEELEGKKTAEDAGNAENGEAPVAPTPSGTEGMIKVFSQGFLLTFLAEWGDRSQIATITLSASNDAIGVTLGAILGHSMCTGLAVVGGKFLASRISEKTVTIVGGVMFLIFAVHAIAFPPQE